MAADHVAVDVCQMAALEVIGDAGLAAHRDEVVGRLDGHRIAVLPQIVGIAFAAAALRVLVQRRGLGRIGGLGLAERQEQQAEECDQSKHGKCPFAESVRERSAHQQPSSTSLFRSRRLANTMETRSPIMPAPTIAGAPGSGPVSRVSSLRRTFISQWAVSAPSAVVTK